MPLKAIFFDIDGTLVDSNEFHVMAWDEAFRGQGQVIAKHAIRGQIGKGADQLIPALFPEMEESQREAVADRQGEIFRKRYILQVKPFARAGDLLQLLHNKGNAVVLASSAAKAEVEYYVHLLAVDAFIKGMVTNDDVASSKPSGDIFAAALAQVFPLAATETLAVGDTPYDVQSALKSGIHTIALRSGGFSEQVLAEAGAGYIYASVKDLYDNFDTSPLQ